MRKHYQETPSDWTPPKEPENPLEPRLRGRAQFLRERGRIKDAELMEEAAAALDFLSACTPF